MRKITNILFVVFLLSSLVANAQLDSLEFDKLVKLGELYSNDINISDKFAEEVEILRTPKLNRIIDILIMVGKADKELLSAECLNRPSNEELKLWYVLREIHYNNQSDYKKQPTEKKDGNISSSDVAKRFLEENIDERWLLSNYYSRIMGGWAKIFNKADLSSYNIELTKFNLKNKTEEASLYYSLMQAFTQRFMVLKMVKNYDKLLEYASKLPKINGKAYYSYTDFEFKDFSWIGYKEIESYKRRHIGTLYDALMSHFEALLIKKDKKLARDLYVNSILSKSEYFKYSAISGDLKKLRREIK